MIESELALVSVIIPCYNQAHFLREAIESVLSQSLSPVEIIVVNDGSTDNTAEVVATYPGVRYIQQVNQGLSAARNAGLRHSTGDYLQFLDADDRLLPKALESGLQCFNVHPECAFVYGCYRSIAIDGSVLPSWRHQRVKSDPYVMLLQGNHIAMHATVMYRRNVFQSVGEFNPSLRACEDYDLFLRIARQYPVACHENVVAEYRQHGANMTAKSDMMLKAATSVLRSQWPNVVGIPHREWAYRRGMKFWQDYYSKQALKEIPLHLLGGRWQQASRAAQVGWQYVRARVSQTGKGIWALAHYHLTRGWQRLTRTPVGRLKWGNLRQLKPLGELYGVQNSLQTPDYYIHRFLRKHRLDFDGRTLLLQYDSVKPRFSSRCQLEEIELDPAQQPLLDDLADLPSLLSDQYDCIIIPQLLQRVYNLSAAIDAVYRWLKPGGVLLLTVPGFNQNRRVDRSYWVFTDQLVNHLLAKHFPQENVTVEAFGNVLAATAHLHHLPANTLSAVQLDHRDTHYQLVVGARAVKPVSQQQE